jgi:hypothetical protein
MLSTRASPETYDLLVPQRGWATAQYADRLADTLAANLLRAGTAGHGKAITRRSAWRSPAEAMRPSGIPIRRSEIVQANYNCSRVTLRDREEGCLNLSWRT